MVIEEIEKLLNEAGNKAGYKDNLAVSFSSIPELCDYQCNDAFSLAKKYGKNPFNIAQEIVDNIEKNDFFEFEVVRPAFINVKLTDKKLGQVANYCLSDEMGGVQKHKVSQRIVLDYGGANVAKSLHAGHLRSPIIGESLKRLYKFLGDEVIADVHLGDWGLQMGLTELQLYYDGVLDYYFKNKGGMPSITLEMLNEAYPKASARKDSDEEFKKEADTWTLKIQNKEEPYYEIYKKMREVSVKEIKRQYGELGATFDLWLGESDAEGYIDKAIKIIEDKGLAKISNDALVVEVAQEGENIPITNENGEVIRFKNPMPPAMLKKYNGASLYATTDIATILMRNETLGKIDRIEYITDQRQKMHFTQVFRVCKMAGISPENQQLLHMSYGTMNGKDGKPFKTRSGDTVKLDDIINLLIERASEKLKANNVEQSRETALMIGVAAMKFGDLSNSISKDYVFDLDRFLSFEGKTGPYLQYTTVRINSILNKIKESGWEGSNEFLISSIEERQIIKSILKLISAYEICYKEKSLNTLCTAVYELASNFSTFYNNHNVINEKDYKVKSSYVLLLKLVRKEIVNALYVLGIEIPKKM